MTFFIAFTCSHELLKTVFFIKSVVNSSYDFTVPIYSGVRLSIQLRILFLSDGRVSVFSNTSSSIFMSNEACAQYLDVHLKHNQQWSRSLLIVFPGTISSPFRYYCLSIIKDNSLVQVYKLARQGGWEEEFPYQCSTFWAWFIKQSDKHFNFDTTSRAQRQNILVCWSCYGVKNI